MKSTFHPNKGKIPWPCKKHGPESACHLKPYMKREMYLSFEWCTNNNIKYKNQVDQVIELLCKKDIHFSSFIISKLSKRHRNYLCLKQSWPRKTLSVENISMPCTSNKIALLRAFQF